MKKTNKIDPLINEILAKSEFPRDALPYTEQFDIYKEEYQKKAGLNISKEKFWKMLANAGKKGGFQSGKKGPKSRRFTHEEMMEILRIVPIEELGKRDDLPYTQKFENIYKQFLEYTDTDYTKFEVWRNLQNLAKKSIKPKPLKLTAGDLDKNTVDFLKRMNPWWIGDYSQEIPKTRRWIFNEVLSHLENRTTKIIAIRGPRQVGKSTVQNQIIEHLLNKNVVYKNQKQHKENKILRVQFDDLKGLGDLVNPILLITSWFEQNILGKSINEANRNGSKIYLFFDEVQNLSNWSEQLKSLVDLTDVTVFITGSSALRIDKGKDSLAGRILTLELLPLRLYEISEVRNEHKFKPFILATHDIRWECKDYWLKLIKYCEQNKANIESAFEAFSKFGGYPVCHINVRNKLHNLEKQIIEQVVDRSITHDKPENISEKIIEEIFRILCRNIGNKISQDLIIRDVSERTKENLNKKTVIRIIDYLADTMLVSLIKPMEYNHARQNQPPTVCLADHFIRRALLGEYTPLFGSELDNKDESIKTIAGNIIESVVGSYLNFIKPNNLELFSYPAKQNKANSEVDFVLRHPNYSLPIEVKYKNKINREDRLSLINFQQNIPDSTNFGLIITKETQGILFDDIIAIPAKYLLSMI